MDYLTPEDQKRFIQRREMQKQIAESILEEAFQETREEGEKEGIRIVMFRQGRIRFGEPSEGIQTKLQAINVLEQLETLSERLLQVNSWEELLATS